MSASSRERVQVDDSLLAFEALPLRQTFYPLGFAVTIETNHPGVLAAAEANWPMQHEPVASFPLQVRLGVKESTSETCPPFPLARAQFHLLNFFADQENFITCDLRMGVAFGWVTTAVLRHEEYLRHCILEAAVMTLLAGKHMTPLHAACVSFAGQGLLLCGTSGAGKSTLSYACARAGWTYTCDDAAYLRWNSSTLDICGNARQFRFRPATCDLFSELRGYDITPRLQGKPSVVIPTTEFPHIATRGEARVDALVLLRRRSSPAVDLVPMSQQETMAMFEESLFPLPYVRDLQRPTLARMLRVPAFVLRYRDLDSAIVRLAQLAHELAS